VPSEDNPSSKRLAFDKRATGEVQAPQTEDR